MYIKCTWQLCKSRYLFNALLFNEFYHILNFGGKGFCYFVNVLTPKGILIELFTFYWEGWTCFVPELSKYSASDIQLLRYMHAPLIILISGLFNSAYILRTPCLNDEKVIMRYI